MKKKNNPHNTNETGTRLFKWSESGSSMQHKNEEENTNEIATSPLVSCPVLSSQMSELFNLSKQAATKGV